MLQELILSIQLSDLKEDYRKNFKTNLIKITENKFESSIIESKFLFEPDPIRTELFKKLLEEVEKNQYQR